MSFPCESSLVFQMFALDGLVSVDYREAADLCGIRMWLYPPPCCAFYPCDPFLFRMASSDACGDNTLPGIFIGSLTVDVSCRSFSLRAAIIFPSWTICMNVTIKFFFRIIQQVIRWMFK
jgi:hypothetical protein